MHPHPVPTHAQVDAKILGLERDALPWLALGFGLGVVAGLLGNRAFYALFPEFHRTALVPLVIMALTLLPCYLMGRWRPEGRDPIGLLTARLKDRFRPHEYAWRPDAWAPPGGYPDAAHTASTDPDDREVEAT